VPCPGASAIAGGEEAELARDRRRSKDVLKDCKGTTQRPHEKSCRGGDKVTTHNIDSI